MITKTLFYAGGTVNDSDIITTEYGQIAYNEKYLFLMNKDKVFKSVKIDKMDNDIFYKLLKNKIILDYPEKFFKQLANDRHIQCLLFRKYGLWAYPKRIN